MGLLAFALATVALLNQRQHEESRSERDSQKAVEDKLRAERDLFIGGPVSVVVWRPWREQALEYVSPNIQSLLGRSADELLASRFPLKDCAHEDDLTAVADTLARNVADACVSTWEQQFRCVLPDGRIRWLYSFTVAERDEFGTVDRLRSYLMDETAQRQAAIALESERGFLQTLISTMPDLVWLKDPEGWPI